MLTQEELDRRRFFVTASDVPAILGKSPWVNAADVYWSKLRGSGDKTNDAIEAGNLLEPAVLAWAGQQLGGVVPGDWKVHENGINAASLDGQTMDGEPVEAKTSGIVGPGSPHQWGEAGTDEIPDYYYLQVQAQLLVTGARRAWVPALIGNRGFVMYQVARHERLIATIEAVSVRFWNQVKRQEPPEGVIASLGTLSKIRREANKTVDISDAAVERYLIAKRMRAAWEDEEEQAKAALLTEFGDADAGRWSGGEFTYFEQSRKETVSKACTFRVLREKKPKAEKRIASTEVSAPRRKPDLLERVLECANAIEAAGYMLRDVSASGSHYFVALGKPDIRLSNHPPNEKTQRYIESAGVLQVRVDDDDYQGQLASVLAAIKGAGAA